MKKLFLLSLVAVSLISSLSLFADDSAPKSVQVTGEAADKIASLSFLSSGASASGNFVNGKVKVICRTIAPLVQPESEEETQPVEQHYTCTLSEAK